jgi:uncharacterized protein YbjT (DUF2867 family)
MILVTGAGGTVGSELVKTLSASGLKFRAAYNSPQKVERAKREGLDAVAIDYARPETLEPALVGVDRLFLLATGFAGQTEGEINAVRQARNAKVRHVVKLSVWGAETEAFSFAKVHRPVEKEIESSGLAWTFLRPNSFMQNMATFYAATIKTQWAFYIPSKGCSISHIDVRDIAAVALKAFTANGHEGKAWSLSGPEALTYIQIADKLSAAIGKKVSYIDISEEEFKKGAVSAGIPEFYADAIIDLIHDYEAGHGSGVTQDVERVTGRKPIDFDRFARDYADAFR